MDAPHKTSRIDQHLSTLQHIEEKRKRRRWVLGIVAILLVSAFGVFAFQQGKGSPSPPLAGTAKPPTPIKAKAQPTHLAEAAPAPSQPALADNPTNGNEAEPLAANDVPEPAAVEQPEEGQPSAELPDEFEEKGGADAMLNFDHDIFTPEEIAELQKANTFVDGSLDDVQAKKLGAGFPNLQGYLSGKVTYPDAAKQAGTQGTVRLKVSLDAEGKVTQASLMQGIGNGCEEELMRVIAEMPNWSPATLNGSPVPDEVVVSYLFQ